MEFMLSKEQYQILCNLRAGISVDEDALFEILMALKNMGYVYYKNYKQYDFFHQRACDFKITENGKIACEEYEKSLRQEDREIKSLQIAEEAKRKASQANKISVWAIVVSALLGIGAIIASVLSALYV